MSLTDQLSHFESEAGSLAEVSKAYVLRSMFALQHFGEVVRWGIKFMPEQTVQYSSG